MPAQSALLPRATGKALDGASERAVLRALDRLMVGRTTLLVTHRPQALRHVDAVVRLGAGARIV